MKTTYFALLTASLLMVGCENQSTPGGPGAPRPYDRNTSVPLTTPENAFQLDVPNLETTIKQGETKTISIGINRGKNFDQDVTLNFSEPPKGVKITPATPMIRSGDKNVQVSVEAANDAAIGEHTINLTGTPARDGAKATNSIKIEVKKP